MSTMRAELDVSSFIADTDKLVQANSNQIRSIQGLIAVTNKYNDAGEETGVVLRRQMGEFEQLEATYKKTAKGYELVSSAVKKTKSEMDALNEIMRKDSVSANVAAFDKLFAGQKRTIENEEKILKIRREIFKLNPNLITPLDVSNVGNIAKSGAVPAGIGEIGKLGALLQEAFKIKPIDPRTIINADAFKKYISKDLLANLRLEFNPKGDPFNEGGRRTIQNALNAIYTQVKLDPKLDGTKIKSVLDSLKRGEINFDDPSISRVSNELSKILAIYQKIRDARARDANLNSDKLNTSTQKASEIARNDAKAEVIAERIRRTQFAPQQAKLTNIDPLFALNETKLAGIARKAAELGRQAGLTSREVVNIFEAVKDGSVSNIDGKFNRVTQAARRYFDELERQKKLSADRVTGGGLPTPNSGGLPTPDSGGLNRLTKYADFLERIRSSLQFFVIYKGFSNITDQLSKSVSSAREFETSISLIRTISQDSQLTTKQWSDGIADVSTRLGVDFKEAASAAYDAVSNQVAQGAETFKFLQSAGNLAKTTGSSIKDSGNLLASALNIFGSEAGTADQIAAKFFRTIDLGRISVSDMANTFGRVGFSAKDMGVNIDEINGVIAHLTRNGVTGEDAMTLLNNLLTQMAKPSVDLTKEFDAAGIASGRMAVRIAGGLVPALMKLKEATDSGRVDLSKLIPEMRGARAFSGLSPDLSGLKEDIRKVGDDATAVFNKALVIREEPVAEKLNKIANAVQVSLATSFGQTFNRLLVGGIETAIGGDVNSIIKDKDKLRETIEKLEFAIGRSVRIASTLTATFVTGKAALIAFTAVTEIMDAATRRRKIIEDILTERKIANTFATRAQITAEMQLNQIRSGGSLVGAVASKPGLGIAALGVAAIAGLVTYENAVVDTYSAAQQAVDDLDNKMRGAKTEEIISNQVNSFEELRKKLSVANTPLLKQLSDELSKSNLSLEGVRDKSSAAGEAMRTGFAAYLGTAKGNLQDVEKILENIKTRLGNIGKGNSNFKTMLDDIILSSKQQYATDPQFIQVTQNQINADYAKIKDLYAKGTEESVAEAEKLFNRIATSQNQIFERDVKMRVDAMKEAGGGEVAVDQSWLINEQNKLMEERLRLSAAYTASLEEQKKIKIQEIAVEKDRIATFEKNLKAFEDFTVFNKDGNIKTQFKSAVGNKLDINKVNTELNRLGSGVTEGLKTGTAAERLQVAALIQERKKSIREEANAVEINEKLREKQSQSVEEEKNLGEQIKKNQEELVKYYQKVGEAASNAESASRALAEHIGGSPKLFRAAIDEKAVTVASNGNPLIEASNALAKKIAEGERFVRDSLPNADREARDSAARGLQEQLEAAANELKNAQRVPIRVNGKDVLDVKRIQAAIDKYKELKEVTRVFVNTQAEEFNAVSGKGKVTGKNKEKLDALLDVSTKNSRNDEALKIPNAPDSKTLEEKINNAIKLAQDGQLSIGNSAAAVIGTIGSVADSSSGALERLIQQADRTNTALQRIQIPASIEELLKQSAETKKAVDPQYKAYGGPIGRDNVPLWAAGGESVNTEAATSQFYSQIMSMNSTARVPRHFSGGGMVSNDSYNVTVNESKTPQLTARAMTKALQRQRRTG